MGLSDEAGAPGTAWACCCCWSAEPEPEAGSGPVKGEVLSMNGARGGGEALDVDRSLGGGGGCGFELGRWPEIIGWPEPSVRLRGVRALSRPIGEQPVCVSTLCAAPPLSLFNGCVKCGCGSTTGQKVTLSLAVSSIPTPAATRCTLGWPTSGVRRVSIGNLSCWQMELDGAGFAHAAGGLTVEMVLIVLADGQVVSAWMTEAERHKSQAEIAGAG